MYSFFVASAAALVAFAAIALPSKAGYAIVPALFAFGGVYFLLVRHHSKKVEGLMEKMGRELQQQRLDNAIRVVEAGYAHGRWVPFMTAQLRGQVGTLHFIKKDFDAALPLLEAAWSRHWVAKAMLAAYHWRKHQADEAFAVLDKAIASSNKEPMLYGIKAWMKVKLKDRDAARAALAAGQEATKGNAAIQTNLVRLQNGQDLQMWQFGETWWNFHLEKPSGKAMQKLAGAMQPKGMRKAQFR
jgi:hypothetical protein